LNYALSGMPYWTTDIGGYWLPDETKFPTAEYQETYMRWFEFGVFCPVFRAHGHRPDNEIWAYPLIEKPLIEYDKLRYRMMPYIYSLAWQVHANDYTIQRPLVMDFGSDPAVWNIADQFMFGPNLLVNPVIEAGATERNVYLPKDADWFDFWTGAAVSGGRHVAAAAPLDRIPVFVRAGSILPLGPDEEYADQKTNGPIELRVYPGADATFTLYNDEGDNYNYEKGAHSLIPIHWSEAGHTLTIGARAGSYTGMAASTELHIHWMNSKAVKTVTYTGSEISVKPN